MAVQHITCMIIDNLHTLAREEGAVMEMCITCICNHAISVECGHLIDRNGIV